MSTSPHTPGAQAKLGRSRSPHTPGTQAKLDRSRAARQARARDREVVQKLAAESGIFQGVVFALSRKATSEDGDPAKAAAAAAAGKISTSALLRETIARQGGIVSNTVHKKVGLSQSQSSSSSSTVGPADEPAPAAGVLPGVLGVGHEQQLPARQEGAEAEGADRVRC